ncbi:MAG: aromatic ring-hydroxylating dioxygenase subunit alpha [Candidatus Eisenbacteria bacterium]|uniref:Aromatic ring-hydroxylating dioxygenase subunit alpha n=1 Tax=Eiseniibacteriota bacterium TaxID=2212470 RepID=A0A956LXG3_UNCEI|nr:aromatic ring-hydroxylating dioxygenase subunit alpha [Candidatus Eisenbacteria bacterium]
MPPLEPSDLEPRPLVDAETIPADWYVDARFHDLDRVAVLARSWQLVGHASQIPEPGDLLCLTVAGEPILAVRGEDGRVRGFFNVCRHRGGPLALQDGKVSALRCHYHGWTYALDGRLRGVPEMAEVQSFRREDFGLVPLTLVEWEGLLFVCLDDAESNPADLWGDIPGRIAPQSLARSSFVRRVRYEIGCNWKVYVDNFLEGYHLPIVHPELCKLLDYRRYVTELGTAHSLQFSPFLDAGAGSPYRAGDDGADGRAFYYFLWPNTMLNILPGRLQINRVLPLASDRTEVHFDYLYEDTGSPKAEARIAADIDYSDRVQQEDVEICELVQRGLSSRAYQRGRFSAKRESGVHHFQNLLRAAYARAVDAETKRADIG